MASKFVKDDHKQSPKISTAALPDIVFMLLFFFMVAASIKSSNYENFIKVETPYGQRLTKMSNSANLNNYIYVGTPTAKYKSVKGNQPNAVVAEDRFVNTSEIPALVGKWRKAVAPEDYKNMKTMINVDKNARMGVVQEIEDGLGRAQSPVVVYSGKEGDPNKNFQ